MCIIIIIFIVYLFQVLFTPSVEGWLNISNEFQCKWQMPNCVGALDGKHVVHQVSDFLW